MSKLEKIYKEICSSIDDIGLMPRCIQCVQKFQRPSYSLEDVVNFVQEKLDNPETLRLRGFVLSLLINQKITNYDDVTLKLNPYGYAANKKMKIAGMGFRLPRGKLTIIGDTGDWTGEEQQGGALVIKGDVGYGTSLRMRGGMLITEGEIKGIHVQWKGGIIVEKDEIKMMNLKGWDALTIAPIDERVPREVMLQVLEEYTKEYGHKDVEELVKDQDMVYKLRLRKLDQELPIVVMSITEPQKKLAVLKALEQEVRNNPTREIIKFAKKCGVYID